MCEIRNGRDDKRTQNFNKKFVNRYHLRDLGTDGRTKAIPLYAMQAVGGGGGL